MNARQLAKLGVSRDCVPQAIQAVQTVAKHNRSVPKDQRIDVEQAIRECATNPRSFLEEGGADGTPERTAFLARYGTFFKGLAEALVEDQEPARSEPIPYRTWGEEIDPAAHHQMKTACSLPVACGAALMPDAHVGYGLPIGGVLALENAVAPYAVGVDNRLDFPLVWKITSAPLSRGAVRHGIGLYTRHDIWKIDLVMSTHRRSLERSPQMV